MGLFKPVVFYKPKVIVGGGTPPLVTTNLISHWDFGNPSCYPGSGTAVTDLKGYRNGTFSNLSSANYSPTDFDGSIFTPSSPDTTERRIVYSGGGFPTPSGAFTWIWWLKRAYNGNLSGLSYAGNGSGTAQKIFYYGNENLQVRLTSGASNICITGFNTLNVWYQLAIVRDGSNKIYTQINDGTLIDHSKTDGGNPTWSKILGPQDGETGRQWYGSVGPVLWYNTNLSQSDIAQNYDHFKGRA